MTDFTGIVLCGGHSSRMGSDKALVVFEGMPLLRHQIETLRYAGANRIIVSGSPRPGINAEYIEDEYPDRGPLGGLHAALKSADVGLCMVLAVDVPLVRPETVLQLLKSSCDSPITLVRHPAGIEPLCGIYRADLFARIPPLIADHGAPVRALAESVGYRTAFFPDEHEFTNLNTPEELNRMIHDI